MLFFKKKRITAAVFWTDKRGRERSVQKTVVRTHKTHIIVLLADGKHVRVKVET